MEAPGDVGQSVVLKVKLPQGRAALRHGFGVMMAVRMKITLLVVVVIRAVVVMRRGVCDDYTLVRSGGTKARWFLTKVIVMIRGLYYHHQ